ncbi:hypothetical protein JSQ81_16685 [Sporosarcina sp. Marseille-Q4063]|uniref:plasmid pRiA4b ORF-3 family protein n=1 Tax=Sporosarcina sp. Marseille-Q4063 TaxID=2810514 RepID=UPI001BAE5A7D|nr:plasmid pRiA4b ORF-3 family protein [Sporosarcina sp. Marseille-Q4063]QUW21418.1 hypothetical protein JSQ81_16685 [Sporosarcina sp. Marseille-Q4063]
MKKAKDSKILITENDPTPIVGDFQSYLTYLATHPIKLTKTKGYLTKKDLLAIYPLMKCDTRDVSQHNSQLDYPLLHLFYNLSLILDFFKIKRTQSTATAIIQKEQIDVFMKMTATEQYVTLLDAFWMDADWEELQGEKWGVAPANINILTEALQDIPADYEIDLSQYEEIEHAVNRYGQFFFYFAYFGFWRFSLDLERSNVPSRPYCTIPKSITLTLLFTKIYRELYESWDPYKGMRGNQYFGLFDALFNLPGEFEEEEEEEIESLSELLRPFLSKGEFTSILKKKQPVYIEGTYLLKVMLSSSCWRTLQLSSDHTLLELHDLIQDVFDFDDDHLYAFYMDGKKFSKSCYNSPMDSHGPFVDDAEIGKLELYQGQNFLYLFDFGYEWTFKIQVVEIIEENKVSEPQIIEVFGDAPEQYSW